ncbi:polyketide cyclase [Leptobacterium flavescens]|uniref:Polyketide cyclase n=1 Tax=Leptobacterium flavescens TaxID=472055 RepID=A0A6P0UJN7_9FLAO|nr:ester cyclase [Leptobacterium flavescens]NER13515.1 polyketide cyclase [Leptobacterium flavescens]
MRSTKVITKTILTALIAVLALSCSDNRVAELQKKVDELQAIVDAHNAERELTRKQLETFDELDLVAFNNRDMERLAEIHAEDVRVINPNGALSTPYAPQHLEELKFLFEKFDTKIPEHIIGFGYGEWTAGASITKGKWVKPITLPNGKTLQPTGKEFEIHVATLARWKNGRIVEEHLFWDNAHLNSQIGLDYNNAK